MSVTELFVLYCPAIQCQVASVKLKHAIPSATQIIAQVDDVFMVIVVGEFNSGKSTFSK
jgi:polynucleotide 5'-kinase involved in rRNA processing